MLSLSCGRIIVVCGCVVLARVRAHVHCVCVCTHVCIVCVYVVFSDSLDCDPAFLFACVRAWVISYHALSTIVLFAGVSMVTTEVLQVYLGCFATPSACM